MAESATIASDESPLVLLPQHQHQANPLRMLELVWKGFCPPIIQDRVEVHEEAVIKNNTRGRGHGRMGQASETDNGVSDATTTTSSVSDESPPTKHADDTQRQSIATIDTPSVDQRQQLSTAEESKHYFEIGERPPSDVIGISKAIWEGFCHHADNKFCQHHEKANHHPHQHQQQQSTHQHHRGFCSIIVEHYRGMCLRQDADDDKTAPGGEECSVDSDDSCSVDLSPQSKPRLIDRSIVEKEFFVEDDDEEEDSLAEWEELCDEDDDMPLAEYYNSDKRRSRALQVLVTTLLAVYVTVTLLQQLDTVHDKSFHFALTKKPTRRTQAFAGLNLSNFITVSKMTEGAIDLNMDELDRVEMIVALDSFQL